MITSLNVRSFSDSVVAYGVLNNDEKHMQSMQNPASTIKMLLFVTLKATLGGISVVLK